MTLTMTATTAVTLAGVLPVLFLTFILEIKGKVIRRVPISKEQGRRYAKRNGITIVAIWVVAILFLLVEAGLFVVINVDGATGRWVVWAWGGAIGAMVTLVGMTVISLFETDRS